MVNARGIHLCFLFITSRQRTSHVNVNVRLCWYFNVNDIRFVFNITHVLFARLHLFLFHSLSFRYSVPSLGSLPLCCYFHFDAEKNEIWKEALKCRIAKFSLFFFFNHLKFYAHMQTWAADAAETQAASTKHNNICMYVGIGKGAYFSIHSLKFIVCYKNRVITAWNHLLGFTKDWREDDGVHWMMHGIIANVTIASVLASGFIARLLAQPPSNWRETQTKE